jgi:hypothetical protein
MKSTVLWVLTLCSSEGARSFVGTYHLHLHDRNVNQLYNLSEAGAQLTACFCWILTWLTLRHWRRRWYFPAKHRARSAQFMWYYMYIRRSRDSAVGIATGYGLDDRAVGVRVPVGSRIFSSPHRPHRLWSPPNLISNGYRVLFPRGQSGRVLQLVPRSRKCGSIHPLPHTPSWCSA